MLRLQEELQGCQGMLAAKEEGEALLKAELAQLTERLAELQGLEGVAERLEEAETQRLVCPATLHRPGAQPSWGVLPLGGSA